MYCSFCREEIAQGDALLALCPACEARLLGASPLGREYPWFVAAVRRALFGF